MINTRGFGVNVMPQLAAVDPALYAFDPTKISQGALQAFQVVQAADQLKAERARQQELAMTQQARINQQRALSELAVLNAARQGAVQGGDILATNRGNELSAATAGSDLASLAERERVAALQRQLAGATAQGELSSLGANQNLANLQRQLNVAKTGEELATFKEDAEIQRDLRKAQAAEMKANAARYWAEAAKLDAAAKAGITKELDEATKKWEQGLGDLAGLIGKTPDQVRALYHSGLVGNKTNKAGKTVSVPIASELSALAENIKKPEFWNNPYEDMSPELRRWLGGPALAAQGAATPSVGPESAPSPQAGPARVKVDASGNIARPEAAKETKAKEQPNKQESSSNETSGLGSAATTGGLAALAILSNPKALSALKSGSASVGKALANAWEGRSAAGKFTGKALKTLPKRSLAALGARGASAAAGPVAGLSLANDVVGSALSDEFTGDLSAIEGIALAANAPSFERQAQEAKFDELSSRINAVFRSTKLSEEQREAELQSILDERQAILDSLMANDPSSARKMMPPQILSM
jgi:hypothetical protein